MINKPQWITIGVATILVAGLYAATQKQIFGPPKHSPAAVKANPTAELSFDTILFHAKEKLTPEQSTRIGLLEQSITRGDVQTQRLHIYHELARFWLDTARNFAPFAWYTAEAARLENSEKSLTFAARLFLNGLSEEADPQLRKWEAFQAQDLFERSLKLNPGNDSARVELGTTLLYGGIAMPMEGINMIKQVVDKDSTNLYALLTLADASLVSGQSDKAIERFKKVVQMQPSNLKAIFGIAETAEQMGNKAEALEWYKKSLPYITVPEMKQEVEARIARLKK